MKKAKNAHPPTRRRSPVSKQTDESARASRRKPSRAPESQKPAAAPTSGREAVTKEDRSTADKLVELALSQYYIGRTDSDEAFAVEKDGPNIALMLDGARDALRSALSRKYRGAYGKVPTNAALSDAMMSLRGEALEAAAEPVHLRVAEHDGNIVIDLGDASGRAVVVSPGSWAVVGRSPVLFRRTNATGALPVPEPGGDLQELRGLLNVTDESWPVLMGWLVAAFFPDMPHAILLLGGEQGAGKTTTAKALVGLFDPSPAPVRTQPREAKQWMISASASWGVCIDNVSYIPDWLSDALCKAVTGDGWLDRRLYTNSDVFVLSFRRVIMLTSIDAGALRGDLGDRVVLVDLEPIPEGKRATESELDARYKKAHAQMFGALLDLVGNVLKELPLIVVKSSPRMADFARVLAAMDKVTGGRALEIYLGQSDRIAEAVIDADEVAVALQDWMSTRNVWEGTTSELLEMLKMREWAVQRPLSRSWPKTPNAMGGRLKRLTPALKQVGIEVSYPPRTGTRRLVRLASAAPAPPQPMAAQMRRPSTNLRRLLLKRTDVVTRVTRMTRNCRTSRTAPSSVARTTYLPLSNSNSLDGPMVIP